MDQSVLASWAITQKPETGNVRSFVVVIATSITMIIGAAASRVKNPTRSIRPHVISTNPTNGARTSGDGIPILANRPTPSLSENRNF